MTAKRSTSERRRFGRRRMTLHASVLVNRRQPMACVVRNLSARGALLEFPDRSPTAQYLRLIVDDPRLDAACEVRHRKARILGVQFVMSEAQPTTPIDVQAARRLVARVRDTLRTVESE